MGGRPPDHRLTRKRAPRWDVIFCNIVIASRLFVAAVVGKRSKLEEMD
jgi:hypothetical protein